MPKPALNFSFIPFITSQIKRKLFYISICWFFIRFIKIFEYLILFWNNLFCVLKYFLFHRPTQRFERKFMVSWIFWVEGTILKNYLYIEKTSRPFTKSFFKNKSDAQHNNSIKWYSIKIPSSWYLISLCCEIFQIWPLDAGIAIDCLWQPHLWWPKIHSVVFLKIGPFRIGAREQCVQFRFNKVRTLSFIQVNIDMDVNRYNIWTLGKYSTIFDTYVALMWHMSKGWQVQIRHFNT